ncbi:MAG: hypothetical protein Q9227_007267 [Pyrenula ochraceoflavens]
MTVNLWLLAVGTFIICCGTFVWEWFSTMKNPSAPGPRAARLTSWWYLLEAYRGKFEQWNIDSHARYGEIVRVAPDMYSISDFQAIQSIYGVSSNLPKSRWYEAWGDPRIPNHNLFNALDRPFHAAMRRRVAGLYSMTVISKYEPKVNNCISLLLSNLDRLANEDMPFDLQHWMQCYAFDVISEITFGSPLGLLENGGRDNEGIINGIDRANTFSTLMGIDKRGLPLYILRCGNPTKGLYAWVENATRRRAKRVDFEKPISEGSQDFFTKLEAMKEKDRDGFEKYHVEATLTANSGAGSDTTSISLTAAIFYLGTHSHVYAKLKSEISEVVRHGNADSPITFEQAQKLPYLQSVIKESLRMWPATGLPLWRVIQAPGMTIAGTFFPPGVNVGMNSWVMHRDPDIFAPDPNTFRPERWLETSPEQLERMEKAYMPFGLGTRTCIGKNISMLEMTKLIPELVRRYRFEVLSQAMQSTNHWFVKQKDVMVKIHRV